MLKWRNCLATSGRTSWGKRLKYWCQNDFVDDTLNTAMGSSPSHGCGRWVKVSDCTDGGKTEPNFPWKSVSVRWRRRMARSSPARYAMSPNARAPKRLCARRRAILHASTG